MQIERFSMFKTGQLWPITVRGGAADHAFVPNPLPPTEWMADNQTWQLLVEARARVANLDGAGSFLPNPSLLLRPLQRREALKSNSIEGTFVTPEELLLFESEKNQNRGNQGVRYDDWHEVRLYDKALSEGCARIEKGEAINRALICDLHRVLLQSARGKDKNPGAFRETQVFVESGRRFVPPPTEMLEGQIVNLQEYLTADSGVDPLIRAFIAHYQFEAIHPFMDGNGRIGRLVLSLCIYKWLRHSHAWLYLSEFFDRNRSEYIAKLFAVSTNGEWKEWIDFCLLGTIEQAESSLTRCKKLIELKKRYEALASNLSIRMGQIIAMLFSRPFIDVVELKDELGIAYATAKVDLEKLFAAGILKDFGQHRPKRFWAREIYDVAYGD